MHWIIHSTKAGMELRSEILKEHSKKQCDKIVQWVGNSQERFDELFHLFLHDEYRVIQRAAWPVSYAVIAYPHLIRDHFPALIKKINEPGVHDAVKRNGIRLLQGIDIPEIYQGDVMDTCFRLLAAPTEAVAIKAFCITVLGKLAKRYPAILTELKILIEDQLPHQSAAFRSRAKKLLREL